MAAIIQEPVSEQKDEWKWKHPAYHRINYYILMTEELLSLTLCPLSELQWLWPIHKTLQKSNFKIIIYNYYYYLQAFTHLLFL